jgi:hypothetical protein
VRDSQSESDMRVIGVEDLPWPHHLFQCAFADDFEAGTRRPRGATPPGAFFVSRRFTGAASSCVLRNGSQNEAALCEAKSGTNLTQRLRH